MFFIGCWLEQNQTKTFRPSMNCNSRRSDPAALKYPVCLQGCLHGSEEGRDLQPLRSCWEHQRAGRGGEEAGRAGQRPVHQHAPLLLLDLPPRVRGQPCISVKKSIGIHLNTISACACR